MFPILRISTLSRKHTLYYSNWRNQDTLPKLTRRVFKPDLEKLARIRKQPPPKVSQKPQTFHIKKGPRLNNLNMQMLSRAIYDQVFKGYNLPEYRPEILEQCMQSLQKHGMKLCDQTYMEEVDFKIPPLEGENIEEHFRIIADRQAGDYLDLLKGFIKQRLPKKPEKWLMQEGWTRYQPDRKPKKVDFPEEKALIFDVEVCMSAGKTPSLATAVGENAWYGWVSSQVIEGTSNPVTKHQYNSKTLIPLETGAETTGVNLSQELLQPKIVVGHNVSYDRAKIKEQYWLERTGLRFVDTMSLHVCISGVTSYQRAILKSGKTSFEDDDWAAQSSLNSLKEVYKLYCNGELDKEARNTFVVGNLAEVKADFNNLMNYCSKDVEATFEVFKEMLPLFLVRFPHPVTFAGMLELGTAYLPVNSNWDRYINDSEQTYQDLDVEGSFLLSKRADFACQLLHNDRYKEDLWMWDQDWDVKDMKVTKTPRKVTTEEAKEPKVTKVSKVTKMSKVTDRFKANSRNKKEDNEESTLDLLTKQFDYLNESYKFTRDTVLPGYPNWYRKLCIKPNLSSTWTPGVYNISTSMQITPKLLNLTWEGFPLHFIRGQGWGFLIPFSRDSTDKILPLERLLEKCPLLQFKPDKSDGKTALRNIAKDVQDNIGRKDYYTRLKKDQTGGVYKGTGIWCETILEDCCFFMRLPHKDGAGSRVGNPLAKDFLNKFSENVLAGDTDSAEQVLDIARKLSYWRNNRDRIREQMVVWLDCEDLPEGLRETAGNFGAIIPQVVVSGTLTRRAVESTWMTASNSHSERIGSELRAMIQAPPGFSIVGADVDSQELWIAAVIGDASSAKMHGATPFGWMTLSGTKSNGTDMHSITAKAVGISRDHAKVINYARIYGAGQNFAERLLKQFNPAMSASDARYKASKMFELTKGKRIYQLREEFLDALEDKIYTKWQSYEIAKLHNRTLDEMFYKPKWVGGSESAMFNRLEQIAGEPSPVTPFLNGRLSRALEPANLNNDRFLPTRINWVVQSGAVDFLHLMLVSMRWIMKDRARFCLSFHDEVRYLVPDEYKYQAALAMHVTNLITRAFCSVRLGIADLPQSVAFFTSVEVDTVLRKEASVDCKTPSNPHGLENGYGIKSGESLDVHDAIVRARGVKDDWFK